MKVMFDPSVGTTSSYYTTKSATKKATNELSKSKGYSNEEIYNAIMSFKHTISGLLSPKNKTKQLNLLA